MSAYTRGPWSAYIEGDTISIDIGPKALGIRPCIVNWQGFDSCDLTPAERVANARLIAAAPELLEALKELLQAGFQVPSHHSATMGELRRLDIACRAAESAIAKAEGKGDRS